MSLKKKLTVLTFEELCRLNTAPVLRADSNWVKEDGPVKATGNVLKAITHSGAPFGSFADRADTDADGNVLKVTTTGTFFGKFGILTLNANGTYSYKLYTAAQKPAAAKAVQGLSEGETLTESFKYKATDGFVTKGSVLKVTIFGTDDKVTITDLTPAANGGDAVVDEDGLPGGLLDAGRPGEVDSTESATATGTFKISAPDGIDDLTVGSTAVITNGVFAPVTISTPLGNELKIIAFNAATGVITYKYTLLAAETHPGAGEDSIFEQFVVKLTDVDGSSATASLDIRIVDDQPTIAVCEHHNEGDETFSTFGVIVDECVPPGALVVDETDLGTNATSNFAGIFEHDYGADGPGSIVYSLGTPGGASGLVDTATGLPVVLAKVGSTIVGTAGPGGPTVFVISINPVNGDVTLDQQRAVVHPNPATEAELVSLANGLVQVIATITDKDGDTASATLDAGTLFQFYDAAPTAVDDGPLNIPEDDPFTTNVLTNDLPLSTDAPTTVISATLQPAFAGAGTVTFLANGEVTFDPAPGFEGTVKIDYTIKDGDGDTASAVLTLIVAPDSVPKITLVEDALVDEDGLFGANADAGRPGETDANEDAQVEGSIVVDYAGDVPTVVPLVNSIALLDTPALDGQLTTLDGQPVVFALESGVLVGRPSGGGDPVITIAITSASGPVGTSVTYTYQVTLLKPIQHAGNTLEDSDFLNNVTFQVTDNDGSQTQGTFDVEIVDDIPIALAGTSSDSVDEDALLPNGIDGGPGDIGLGVDEIGTGSVAGLFQSGADTPLTYSFDTAGSPPALTSGGVAVTYTVAANLITATAGVTPIFTMALDATTGTWTFTLQGPIDHPDANTEDDITINFGSLIQATDKDGDKVTATGAVNVLIDDDSPTVALDRPGTGMVTLDETSAASTAATIPLGAIVPGNDPDVGGTGAIATALNVGGLLNPTIAFGADGPAAVGPVQYGLLVGAVPPGITITDGSPITLVAVSPTVVAGVVGGGGPFAGQAAFAVQINPTTGAITVEEYLSLDHPLNPDPNDLLLMADGSLLALVDVTDRDGDVAGASVSIASKIRFLDDGPSLTIAVDPYGKAALDETATSSTPAALAVTNVGDDADVAGSGAIATATGLAPAVSVNALFGADGPAAGGGTAFVLNVLNANSGLFTTDGSAITLVEEAGGLVVGRVASGVDSGKAAFAIAISATGVLTVEQYLSLDHPLNPNPDDTVVLATGTLGVDVTVTDGDGDSVTQSADISAQVCFDDDGPSLTVVADAQITAALDETATVSTPATLGVTNIGDDADVGGSGAISATTTSGPLVTATALFGADGPAAGSPTLYALNVTNAVSGLFTTDGSAISLTEEGGLIVGRVASGTLAGQAAFAISISATTGIVKVEQYLSLDHPLNPNPDDTVFLAPGTVEVTVTVTDGDGDSLTAGADVSGQFSFDDDGPTAYAVVNPNLTDDEGKGPFAALSNEGQVTTLGTDADVAGSPATATGGPGTLFAAGADGLQSISITGPAVQAIYKLGSGAPAQEAVNYSSATDGSGNVTLTGTGAISGNVAFTLKINTDGSYLFTQSAALVHPQFTPSNEDDLPLAFNFTVTDKDGDPASGTLTVTVDDDTPVGGAVIANVDEVATLTNLMLIVDISGSMGDPSGIAGLTRIDAAKQAMIALINAYDANGEVAVRIVTFSTGAAEVGTQWMDAAAAIAAINALADDNGVTNYDAPIETVAPGAFTDPGKITGGNNVSYFLSDGEPNRPVGDEGISSGEEAAWQNFLNTNDIVSFALGMGTGVGAAELDPIAYNGVGAGTNTNAVIVDDFADLSGVLVGTATPTLVSGTVPGSFGADGGLFSLTNAGPPSGFTYTVTGNTLLVKDATTLATVLTLTIDPVTGAYSVKQNGPIDHPGAGADVLPFVFTVNLTDGDFDGATSTITVNIKDGVPTAANVVAGTLDDDSKAGGLAGGPGDFDPTLSTLSGSLGTAYGSDGPGTISFAGLAPVVINGITVTFSWNAGTSTLTANDGEEDVFEVVVNQATGGYTVKLLASLDHHTNALADNLETDATFNLGYTITDGDGDAANGTLSFTIDDDTPVAGAVSKTISEATNVDTNIMLILDVSGSMDDASGLTGLSRLDVLKASVVELLEQYDAIGNVAVRIVTFSSNAAPVGGSWTSVAAAKASVLGLTAGGATNYDEALTDAIGAFGSAGKIVGAQNVSYFISDGQPTAPPGDIGIDAAEQAVWENFLADGSAAASPNDIVSYALGAGSGVSVADLNPVAYNGVTNSQIAPIVVTDLSQLTATLVGTVAGATTSGNVLTDGLGGFGADGGYVSTLAIGGRTFAYDPITDTISATGAGAATHTFNAATNVITITTAIGGQLSLDLDNGTYSYTGPASVASNQSDVFTYTLTDGDGDKASSTLTINILDADRPPIVRDDGIITNISGGAIVIPHFALTYNDQDPDGQAISITAAGAPQNDVTSVVLGATTVTFNDNDTDGGTFTYTGSTTAPAGSDTATVTVTRRSAGTDPLDGNGLDNIIINSDNSDTLRGFEGDDVLVGNGGNDILNGGIGKDLMQGGAGNDTFVFTSAGDSPTLAAADTILDFDVASATERIDLSAIFGGTLAFGGLNVNTVSNSVTWSQDVANNQTIVRADVNGNTTADIVIKLGGLHTLAAGDFVL